MRVDLYVWSADKHFTFKDAVEAKDVKLVADYIDRDSEYQKIYNTIDKTLDFANLKGRYFIEEVNWVKSKEIRNELD